MNLKNLSAMLLVACALLPLMILPCSTSADLYQPRSDMLVVYSYADPHAAYTALKAGEIDLYAYPLTEEQYNDAVADPHEQLARTKPTRKERMPDFGQHSSGWCWVAAAANSFYWFAKRTYPNYPKLLDDPDTPGEDQKYDTEMVGTDPNDPDWYDPGCQEGYKRLLKEIAKDANKTFCQLLTGTWDQIIAQLKACYEKFIKDQGYESELKVDSIQTPSYNDYRREIQRCEDVILILNWNGGHAVTGVSYDDLKNEIEISDPWTPGLAGPDHNNDPSKMQYDKCNVDNATELRINYHGISTRVSHLVTISPNPQEATNFYAYTDLLGVVNMEGVGICNDYTFINTYRPGGGPIRIGLAHPPQQLNPFYSSAYSDYLILDRLFQGLMSVAPYNTLTDQPWIAQDWEKGQWVDGTETKDKNTYWIRKDWYWQDGTPVTAADYKFSMQLLYQCGDAWNWIEAAYIHHIKIIDAYTVEVYMNVSTDWTIHPSIYPIIPKHKWQRTPITTTDIPIVETFHEGTTLTTPGTVPLSEPPCWMDSVTADGVPLVECTDYEWVKGELVIFKDLPDCTDVEVTYWAKGDPSGVTPGNLPWNEVLISCGQWMITEYNDPTLPGGWGGMEPNPYNSIVTPLGEVDWRWNIVEGQKPRSGYYKIDIFDVVLACRAYGSWGNGLPDPYWFPGVDLAEPGHNINIYDVVTITGKYDTIFGQPPP